MPILNHWQHQDANSPFSYFLFLASVQLPPHWPTSTWAIPSSVYQECYTTVINLSMYYPFTDITDAWGNGCLVTENNYCLMWLNKLSILGWRVPLKAPVSPCSLSAIGSAGREGACLNSMYASRKRKLVLCITQNRVWIVIATSAYMLSRPHPWSVLPSRCLSPRGGVKCIGGMAWDEAALTICTGFCVMCSIWDYRPFPAYNKLSNMCWQYRNRYFPNDIDGLRSPQCSFSESLKTMLCMPHTSIVDFPKSKHQDAWHLSKRNSSSMSLSKALCTLA